MNWQTFFGTALVLCFSSLANASPEASRLELRVMSFNVKQHNPKSTQPKTEPSHWERRKSLVFDVIQGFAPDVVGLQEPYRGQVDEIRENLLHYDEVGEGRRGESRDEHCTILYRASRFRAEQSGTFWLSDTPEKPSTTWGHFYPRICTWARLIDKKTGRGLYVFNTHLDHKSQEAREKSVRLIARRIADREHGEEPFVLTGDFNAGERNPVITYLKGGGDEKPPVPVLDSFRILHPDEKTVGTGNRFEGRTDGEKIDYVFVPPGTAVLEASIIRTHKGDVYPSDHFPVTARLRLGNPAE